MIPAEMEKAKAFLFEGNGWTILVGMFENGIPPQDRTAVS
jgi:hypothetical protein